VKNSTISRRNLLKLATAAAASSLGPFPTKADEASIVIGGLPEDANLDPGVITATDWAGLLRNIYQPLVYGGANGDVLPGLATAWKQLDPVTWEFTTRDNVQFHNGEKFGPEDVEFTIKRIVEGNLPLRYILSSVETATASGPNSVQIKLRAPAPLILKILNRIPIVQRASTKTSLVRQTNGTGPYKLEKWSPGDQLVLQYAPNYWGPKPSVKRVIYRSIPDANSLVAAFQANEVDLAVGLQPDAASKLSGSSALDIKAVDTDRTIFINIDNTAKPFDDARVRKALNLSLDRDALVRDILLGNGSPIANPCGPHYLGYNKSLKPQFDPTKAKELLKEAGLPNGFEFTLNAPSGRYMKDKEIAEAIVGQWSRVGINAKLVLMEFGTLMTGYRNHKLSPAYLIGVSQPDLDGAQFLTTVFNSAGSYFKDPELVAAIVEALKMADVSERRATIEKLNAEVFEKDAYVYLYLQKAIFGLSKKIKWTPSSNEEIDLASIELAS